MIVFFTPFYGSNLAAPRVVDALQSRKRPRSPVSSRICNDSFACTRSTLQALLLPRVSFLSRAFSEALTCRISRGSRDMSSDRKRAGALPTCVPPSCWFGARRWRWRGILGELENLIKNASIRKISPWFFFLQFVWTAILQALHRSLEELFDLQSGCDFR